MVIAKTFDLPYFQYHNQPSGVAFSSSCAAPYHCGFDLMRVECWRGCGLSTWDSGGLSIWISDGLSLWIGGGSSNTISSVLSSMICRSGVCALIGTTPCNDIGVPDGSYLFPGVGRTVAGGLLFLNGRGLIQGFSRILL